MVSVKLIIILLTLIGCTWAFGMAGRMANEDPDPLVDKTPLASHYRIVTVVQPPFVFKNSSCTTALNGTGNEKDCYSGFCIDIMESISSELLFNWTIFDVAQHGDFNINGKWNGMVQELLDNRADIALGALEKTADRETVIDFTGVIRKTEGKSYAIGIRKGSGKLFEALSHMIKKFKTQSTLKKMTKLWFGKNQTKDV